MASGDKKEVRVSMSIDVDDAASMRKVADAFAKVGKDLGKTIGESAADSLAKSRDKSLKILRNLGVGGVAGRVGQFEGYGEAATDMGFGRAGGWMSRNAGRIGGAVGAYEAVAGRVTGIANTLSDPYSTGSQAARSLAKSLPLGETTMGLMDSLRGRSADMERVRVAGQLGALDVGRAADARSFALGYNPEQTGRENRASLLSRGSAVLPSDRARTTAENERAFREEMKIYPLRVQAARAERESTVATKERAEAEKQMLVVTHRRKELDVERARIQAKIDEGGSGVEREKALRAMEVVEKDTEATEGHIRTAAEIRRAAVEREAGAKAEVMRTESAVYGAKADMAEGRAATSASGARRLGGMNAIEQNQAAAAVENVIKFGPQGVPPEMLAMAQATAPETIGKLMEGSGAKSEAFTKLTKIAGADFAGDPERLRRDAAEFRKKEAETAFEAEKLVGKSAADAGKTMAETTADAMTMVAESFKRQLLNSLRIARNAT